MAASRARHRSATAARQASSAAVAVLVSADGQRSAFSTQPVSAWRRRATKCAAAVAMRCWQRRSRAPSSAAVAGVTAKSRMRAAKVAIRVRMVCATRALAGVSAWDRTQQEACREHTRPSPDNSRPSHRSLVAPTAARRAVDVGRPGCERPFMSSAVTYEAGERIARIALDDGKVNAMSLGFFEALGASLDRAESERPGAVVITGRPGIFSAGLDLKLLPTLGAAELRTTLITFARTMLRVFLFPIPTVAAVGGHAIAGGALLMFACDLRVAADTAARLRLNEVAIGLALPSWAILIARSAIPPRWRTEAMLHARSYSPAEAKTRGFVDTVVPPEQLLAAAAEAAAPLAALDPTAYATSKSRLRAMGVKWASELLESEMTGRLPAVKR
ncbi:MAG: crotonase/enoyl-CoA hydratase family protein [Deltaproteobacteria bacterium]|nr:MAG: crotonase/enoyl-CoA hydratase family protein [Deltaproteobacteria bacterium]